MTIIDIAGRSAFLIAGLPRLTFVDVAGLRGPEANQRLAQLLTVHREFFADYRYIEPEWLALLSGTRADPLVVPHLWLALQDDVPVGEVIIHTNLRRRVALVHFVAFTAPVRRAMPRDWLASLSAAFEAAGQIDAAAAGVPLLGVMGEVPPEHVHKWLNGGFEPVPVPYVEPLDGPDWVDHPSAEEPPGPLAWHTIQPILRLAAGVPPDQWVAVADAGLRGFLLDYYRVPATHPRIAGLFPGAAFRGADS